MNIKAFFHVYFHRSFSYGSPYAGMELTWPCTCIKCGASFTITRDNNPQWINPITRDRTKPSHWRETDYWPK